MSLYNMVHGVTQATFFILPMLGKHPDEYPRFRDCFTSDGQHPEYNNHIHIYTRTGGGNREGYVEENNMMRDMTEYVTDFDDGFDSTFASWIFKIPERWKEDFDKIANGNILEVSPEYRAELYRIYPKLTKKFDEIFSTSIVID